MSVPVLIIGSGLGGLTLANSLQNHNIPYKIFERDGAERQRAQGYRISIDNGGADGLRAALTPELFKRFEETCAEQHHPGGRVDGPSGKLIQAGVMGLLGSGGWGMAWALGSRYIGKKASNWSLASWSAWFASFLTTSKAQGPIIPAGAEARYQVDRRVLRSVLLTSQPHHITYDFAFTSYTLENDCVIAHFANGTSVRGSLLVGADGVRSKVAAQLVGSAEKAAPIDLGIRLVYGKTLLTPDVEEMLHPILQKGTCFVTDTTAEGDRLLLVMEAMRFTHQGAPDNYIFFGLAAKTRAFGMESDEALLVCQGDAAADITTRLTANWDPRIRVILEKQAKDQAATLKMTSSDPDGTVVWPTQRRVTVLGDAVHCMPPTGGQGANSAMHDAGVLGVALANGKLEAEGNGGGWEEATIKGYEDAMRYNIGDIVGMACIGASYIMGTNKSVR